MPTNLNRRSTATSGFFPPVVKADADLPDGVCRALWLSAAGNLNLMDAEGNVRTSVACQAGFNPFSCKQVRSGGDAVTIWALY